MRLNRQTNINTQEHWNGRYKSVIQETHEHTMLSLFFKMKLLPCSKPYSLMDVGCGIAKHFQYIKKVYNSNIDFYGCDISDIAIEHAKKNNGFGEYYCLDIHKDKLPGIYDYVVCYHTLEHFNSPTAALAKMRKACKKKVLICVPYKEAWNYEQEHMWTFDEKQPFKDYEDFLLDNEGSCIYTFAGKAK